MTNDRIEVIATPQFYKRSDELFLWALMPDWIQTTVEGLSPSMYGTGSYEGDKKESDKVKNILNIKEE